MLSCLFSHNIVNEQCAKCGKHFCKHEFETSHMINITENSRFFVGAVFIQKCKKCGKMTQFVSKESK